MITMKELEAPVRQWVPDWPGLILSLIHISSRSFYEQCGFTVSHRIKNFFTDNYDHLIYEDGEQLVDMIYLKKTF